MHAVTIAVLRGVIALALAGSLVVEIVILPLLWSDLAPAPWGARTAFVVVAGVVVLMLQVVGICIWRLLTLVRRGGVFSAVSLRWVDAVIVALAVAALAVFVLAALLAPGATAPGVVGLVAGGAVVLGGVALVVVVMRMLLVQATAREQEARALRAELGAVI
jgi:hypothetical protein